MYYWWEWTCLYEQPQTKLRWDSAHIELDLDVLLPCTVCTYIFHFYIELELEVHFYIELEIEAHFYIELDLEVHFYTELYRTRGPPLPRTVCIYNSI